MSEFYFNVSQTTSTFLARVLNLTPLAGTTVIVTWPVLLVLMSRMVPDLPLWVPAITLHWAPSVTWAVLVFGWFFLIGMG
jgi:hypothetical protein